MKYFVPHCKISLFCRLFQIWKERPGPELILKGDHVTFEGGTGDLVWERILFLNLSPTYSSVKFFLTHYTPREIFFSVQENFSPDISLQDCLPSKSVCRISFFLKLPVTSPAKKSQMVSRSAPYYKLQKLLILVETVNFSVFVSNS